MRKTILLISVTALALAGCKSAEQKSADLHAQLQAVNDQYQKDCPQFDEKDRTGLDAAFGEKTTPELQSASQQRHQQIQANLNSPHCKELKQKLDGLYAEVLKLQSQ